MIKEAIGVADTVEEAKEKALAELNVSFEEDVQVEVVALPKKKTLGLFGGSPAKVKVSVEVPDPKPQKAPKQKDNKKAEPKKTSAKKTEAKEEENKTELKFVPAAEVDANSPAGKGVAYLQTVLEKLGCSNIEISVAEITGGSQITLTGEGLGVVIGHRGETLDALQYLVSLAANAGVSGYYRVVLMHNNKKKTMSVHRLVARAWLLDYSNDLQINHKDGNKLNNDYRNLEMCTVQENIRHSITTGLKPKMVRNELGRYVGKEVM